MKNCLILLLSLSSSLTLAQLNQVYYYDCRSSLMAGCYTQTIISIQPETQTLSQLWASIHSGSPYFCDANTTYKISSDKVYLEVPKTFRPNEISKASDFQAYEYGFHLGQDKTSAPPSKYQFPNHGLYLRVNRVDSGLTTESEAWLHFDSYSKDTIKFAGCRKVDLPNNKSISEILMKREKYCTSQKESQMNIPIQKTDYGCH